MTAGSLLGALRRRGGLILLPALLAAAVALVLSLLSTSMYRASAEVLVETSLRSITSEASVAGSSEVVDQVREQIGTEPGLSVDVVPDTDVLEFTATSSNADNAALAANTHASTYVALRSDGGAQLIEPATIPSDPYEPQTVRNVVLAFIAGLVIGLVAALVVSQLDTTIRSKRRLRDVAGVPNLAVIPRVPLGHQRPDDLAALGDPNSIAAEGYRTLRTAVEFLMHETGAKVLLVTSPRPGEGKSSVAANLAVTAGQAGRNVVLIDGDLRKPQMHRSFNLRNDRGLSSVLAGDATLSRAVQRLDAAKSLVVLSAGPPPPDPADLLLSDRLGKAIEGLARAADLVVIDAPPILPVTDSTILAQHCDAVLLAATDGLSDRREWAEGLNRLKVIRANVIGTVLSRPDSRIEPSTAYHYAPTAAPANWWVTQTGGTGGEGTATATATDTTSVMQRDTVDDLLAGRSTQDSTPTSSSHRGRPDTAPRPSEQHSTDAERRDGSDPDGDKGRPDGRLESAGAGNPNGGDPADQADPPSASPVERRDLPPPQQ